MAFGYSFLCGCRGAEGYIRETEGKRSISVRGMRPGETCFLYALTESGAEMCDQKTADVDGHAALETVRFGPVFIVQKDTVRLWEGDDGVCLRACAFLSSQRPTLETTVFKEKTTKNESAPKETAEKTEDRVSYSEAAEIKENFPQEKASPTGKEETEPVYTLRAPGSGEPVDALPEKYRKTGYTRN